MILRYILGWFILATVAIINGAVREGLYRHVLGDLPAHQLSTFTAIVLLGSVIWIFSRWWPLSSARQAWTIGLLWLVMTVVFEFVFGHFVAGHSWHKLLADYDLLAGRLWLLVLIWITIAPWVFHRLLGSPK